MTSGTRQRVRGVIAAIPTPVGETGPDHQRLIALAKHLLETGCDGLNLLGTTGEATSFSVDERKAVMAAVAQAGLPLHRIMVGTGAAALADTVTLSRHAADLGFAGILLIPPFYYKRVEDVGLTTYVRRIADATAETAIPIYLYNYPALSGIVYSVQLVRGLVKQFGHRISGLKDSSGDMLYADEIASISETLDVFPSSEAHLLTARSGRFAGCISATVNITSQDCAKAFHMGDEEALSRATAARNIFYDLPLISAVKLLLSVIHRDRQLAYVVPPLTELSSQEAQTLLARFHELPRWKFGIFGQALT